MAAERGRPVVVGEAPVAHLQISVAKDKTVGFGVKELQMAYLLDNLW
jgi:hypothetical protein